MNKKIVGALVVGIIIGALAGYLAYAKYSSGLKYEGTRTDSHNSWEAKREISVNQSEINDAANFTDQPAAVQKIVADGKNWTVSLDLLTRNPDFQPGLNDFFLNQNPKVRVFSITPNTKMYKCDLGADDNATTPDVMVAPYDFMKAMVSSHSSMLAEYNRSISEKFDYKYERQYPTYYFDTEGSVVAAIREQCLP